MAPLTAPAYYLDGAKNWQYMAQRREVFMDNNDLNTVCAILREIKDELVELNDKVVMPKEEAADRAILHILKESLKKDSTK